MLELLWLTLFVSTTCTYLFECSWLRRSHSSNGRCWLPGWFVVGRRLNLQKIILYIWWIWACVTRFKRKWHYAWYEFIWTSVQRKATTEPIVHELQGSGAYPMDPICLFWVLGTSGHLFASGGVNLKSFAAVSGHTLTHTAVPTRCGFPYQSNAFRRFVQNVQCNYANL